jgi:hypothetical protein
VRDEGKQRREQAGGEDQQTGGERADADPGAQGGTCDHPRRVDRGRDTHDERMSNGDAGGRGKRTTKAKSVARGGPGAIYDGLGCL